MNGFVLYDFRIDVWRPETLPLSRLSKYTAELAKLFGAETDVHLLKVRKGSAVPELAVAETDQAKVAQRLQLLHSDGAPDDLKTAFRSLNQLLREDSGSAILRLKGGAKILEFPGQKTPLAEEVIVHEAGSLDGVVIRVGGRDESVPVWLEGENREKLACNASRSLAKELAQRIFGEPVRVTGAGKWRRNAERLWELEEFIIKTWEPLVDSSLLETVAALRGIPGNGWAEMDDPQAEWRRLRGTE